MKAHGYALKTSIQRMKMNDLGAVEVARMEVFLSGAEDERFIVWT